jgi:hypothetical protein
VRALPLLAVLVAVPAHAQINLPLDKIPATRSIRELMIDVLEDPRVQVKLGITSAQRQLMDLRLSQNTLKFGLGMAKNAFKGEDDPNFNPMQLPLENSPAHALFPFLADNQLAKLRRLTVADDALAALGTDEVAFAVGLTATQRKSLDAMRLRYLKTQMNPNNPAYKAAMAGFGELASLQKDADDTATDSAASIARVERLEKAFDRMFAQFARAIRLDAKSTHTKEPNALSLLTPAQRHRFRDLQSDPVATKSRR